MTMTSALEAIGAISAPPACRNTDPVIDGQHGTLPTSSESARHHADQDGLTPTKPEYRSSEDKDGCAATGAITSLITYLQQMVDQHRRAEDAIDPARAAEVSRLEGWISALRAKPKTALDYFIEDVESSEEFNRKQREATR